MNDETKAIILDIQEYSIQNGPGIRTTVFVKGCPLRCKWCASPDSTSSKPELGFKKNLCNLCGYCVEVCPVEAISIVGKKLFIDRKKCAVCGECLKVCYPNALTIFGREMSTDEVLHIVKKSRLFFMQSGGGVTVSGGEPLSHPSFVIPFLSRCKDIGLHVCIDTTGFASSNVLKEVAEYTDLFLYDLKHMDSAKHEQLTGVPNDVILENAKWVAQKGIPMIIRIPLIPGINNAKENIRATADFARSLQSVDQVDILPYHKLGANKYTMLDRPYPMDGLERCSKEEAQKAKQIITTEFDFQCQLGG